MLFCMKYHKQWTEYCWLTRQKRYFGKLENTTWDICGLIITPCQSLTDNTNVWAVANIRHYWFQINFHYYYGNSLKIKIDYRLHDLTDKMDLPICSLVFGILPRLITVPLVYRFHYEIFIFLEKIQYNWYTDYLKPRLIFLKKFQVGIRSFSSNIQ